VRIALSPPLQAEDKWRAVACLHLHCWDDEFVAYHGLSGDTHLLNKLTGNILRVLQRGPADALTLSDSLAAVLDTKADDEFKLQISHDLADLDTLALIERA